MVMTQTPTTPSRARRRTNPDASITTWRIVGVVLFSVAALILGLTATIPVQLSIGLALLACMGALALNLLMGTAGQVSIGNAALLAVGAYGTVWFSRAGVPFPFDIICAGVTAGVVGLLIGLPALRLRGLYLAIATLAAYYIVVFIAVQYQNGNAGPAGFLLDPVVKGNLRQSQSTWLIIIVIVVALTALLVGALMSGRTGRTWRLIRDHENIVSTFGVSATRWKLSAFVISSIIIGLQGGILAHFTGSVSIESFSLSVAITYIAMVVVGGLDSIAGSIIGALLISLLPTVVPSIMRSALPGVSPSAGAYVSAIVYGALILAFVVWVPKGISGLLGKIPWKSLPMRRSGREK